MTEVQSTEYLADLDINDIMRILPHRYPMLLVDKITKITATDGAVGIKNVTMNEPFFEGHFPGKPVMPGVMIIEAMAQTAAAYTAHVEEIDTSDKIVLFMGVDKAKFRRPVFPGDQLEIHVKVSQRRAPVWKYEAKAKVNGKVVTEASYGAMLIEPDNV